MVSSSATSAEKLDAWLCADSSRLEIFVEASVLHRGLRELILTQSDPSSSDMGSSATLSPAVPISGSLSNIVHGTINYFPEGMPLAYLIATVVTGLGILIASHVYMSRPEQVAQQPAPLPSSLASLPLMVGRITAMADCLWVGDAASSRDVRLGQRYQLAAGLMEVTFAGGAKVVLQGPATFQVESNGGYLAAGRLMGKLVKRGEGREERGERAANHRFPNPKSRILNPSPLSPLPSPLFVIHTPTATVTDLGTEFAVEVKQNKSTEVSVIRGGVEITGGMPVEGNVFRSRLVAGEAARIASPSAQPQRISLQRTRLPWVATIDDTWRIVHEARTSPLLHATCRACGQRIRPRLGRRGKAAAGAGRQEAFQAVTDGVFASDRTDGSPASCFQTGERGQARTAFVGLLYDSRVRFDRIKLFLGPQTAEGGCWREPPRLFLLKNHTDTNQTPPETDPANWREVSLGQLHGALFDVNPSDTLSRVIEIALAGLPPEQRTGYGWAIGGEAGSGRAGYVSVAELRAYGVPTESSVFRSIDGLLYHLDAAEGVIRDRDGNVTIWADQSGNGNDFSATFPVSGPAGVYPASTAANRPHYVAARPETINGLPVVQFNGADSTDASRLVLGKPTSPTTIFMVERTTVFHEISSILGYYLNDAELRNCNGVWQWSTGGIISINGKPVATASLDGPTILEATITSPVGLSLPQTAMGGNFTGERAKLGRRYRGGRRVRS